MSINFEYSKLTVIIPENEHDIIINEMEDQDFKQIVCVKKKNLRNHQKKFFFRKPDSDDSFIAKYFYKFI
jgi:outer membrane lipopolysaccharide assembly protein LptE/RlpB